MYKPTNQASKQAMDKLTNQASKQAMDKPTNQASKQAMDKPWSSITLSTVFVRNTVLIRSKLSFTHAVKTSS